MTERSNELGSSEQHSNQGFKPETYLKRLKGEVGNFFKGSLKEAVVLGGSFIVSVAAMTSAFLILNSTGHTNEAVLYGFAVGVPILAASEFFIMPRLANKIPFLNKNTK